MKNTAAAVLLLAAVALAGCNRGDCDDADIRCDRARAQSCDDGDWETEHDCAADGATCAMDSKCVVIGTFWVMINDRVLCCLP
jgi:hypothetical protein